MKVGIIGASFAKAAYLPALRHVPGAEVVALASARIERAREAAQEFCVPHAYDDWKLIFMEQRIEATLEAWANPFTPLRMPLIFNLRRDPFERAQLTSNTYYDWLLDHVFFLVPAQTYVGRFLATFQEYPPRQKAASFSLDQVMEKLSTGATQ